MPVTFKALLTEAGPQVKTGLIWRVFRRSPGPNGARKLVSTHHEAMPTAALRPGRISGQRRLWPFQPHQEDQGRERPVAGGDVRPQHRRAEACGRARPAARVCRQSSVRFDILSDDEDQFGNRHKILDDAKPGVVIRLNAGAYHIVSTYGDANATVRADVTVEPGKITEATVKHAARQSPSSSCRAQAVRRWPTPSGASSPRPATW